MAALDLPVYPARARCVCAHGRYAHTSRCAAEGCSCRRFDSAGGLVPLEIEHVPPFEARTFAPAAASLD